MILQLPNLDSAMNRKSALQLEFGRAFTTKGSVPSNSPEYSAITPTRFCATYQEAASPSFTIENQYETNRNCVGVDM
ncbi:hypothetical protein TNCT_192771 [Trichonephila clavata]|uniref:Uncharacterized protein n=1 Tax=Trichonephila clavata TaxID=2740835 RepID=A0A8X6L4I7_TRICU|nr:hypothetical protein TNCT_192771 [Trichonephila clavata]